MAYLDEFVLLGFELILLKKESDLGEAKKIYKKMLRRSQIIYNKEPSYESKVKEILGEASNYVGLNDLEYIL